MDKLDFEVIKKRELGSLQERVFKVIRKDHEMKIKPDDIRNLVKALQEQAKKRGETIRIMVVGLNGARRMFLKGFDEDLHVFDEDHDYFKGTVKDTTKFSDFAQLQVHVMKQVN